MSLQDKSKDNSADILMQRHPRFRGNLANRRSFDSTEKRGGSEVGGRAQNESPAQDKSPRAKREPGGKGKAREVGSCISTAAEDHMKWRSAKKMPAASRAAAGRVKIQARAMLRMVDSCKPLPLAIMVPATPDERTCVVETGMWY